LVPIDYAPALQADYLPSQLKAEDYPSLIPAGQRVDTIAVPAILAAYNWVPGSERYKKVDRFVQAFFDKFEDLQKPPFHPKWKEVALAAPLQGWKRFPAAQAWLDRHANTASETRRKFDQFIAERGLDPGKSALATPEQNSALFEQFLEWQRASAAAKPGQPAKLNERKRTTATTR
jgi:hypothetical protein